MAEYPGGKGRYPSFVRIFPVFQNKVDKILKGSQQSIVTLFSSFLIEIWEYF